MPEGLTLPVVGIARSNRPKGFHWQVSDHTGNHTLSAVDSHWRIQQVQAVPIADQEIKLVFWSHYSLNKQGLWICDSTYKLSSLAKISKETNISPVEVCGQLARNLLPRKGTLALSGESISLRGLRSDGNYPNLAETLSKGLLQWLRKEQNLNESRAQEITQQLFPTRGVDRHLNWQHQILSNGCISLQPHWREHPYRFHIPIIPVADGFVHGYLDPIANACLLFTLHSGSSWALFDFERGQATASPGINRVIADAINHLVNHCLNFEPELFSLVDQGLALPKVFINCRHSHLGHYLWNDLAGLDSLDHCIATNPEIAESVLHIYVASRSIYGPLEDLLPNLTATVPVSPALRKDMRSIVYKERCQYMRACDDYISASLANNIRDYSLSHHWLKHWIHPGTPIDNEHLIHLHLKEDNSQSTCAQLNVVCFYLRINNRAPANQVEFAIALFQRLLEDRRANSATQFFICGSNTDSGALIRSHLENPEDAPDWVGEQKLAQQIILKVNQNCGHTNVFSLVGSVISHELSVASRADLIVSPWGAGLAKTKWILNRRCLVHTSDWNLLNRPDIHIYEDTSFREGAIADTYFPRECVASVVPQEWEEMRETNHAHWLMLRNGFDQTEESRANYKLNIDPAVEFVCTFLANTGSDSSA